MATTTNYSWTTPDDTDLVKDGAAAIRTLGSAIDTTVFTNAGAAVAKSTIDAKGDLLVGTADNTIDRLAVGTDGYTLVADSSTATGLAYAAPAGGGKVLQVVTATTTTATTIASTTFTDTGLSASITPSAATSKILVLTSQNVEINRQTIQAGVGIRLMRDATSIAEYPDYKAFNVYTGNATHLIANTIVTLTYLDSPNTTSAITYKTH
jgi:hypothetical protein